MILSILFEVGRSLFYSCSRSWMLAPGGIKRRSYTNDTNQYVREEKNQTGYCNLSMVIIVHNPSVHFRHELF